MFDFSVHLAWFNSDVNRIVRETVKKHIDAYAKEKEDDRLAPFREQAKLLFGRTNEFVKQFEEQYRENYEFTKGTHWNIPVGTTLKIKLPNV